MSSAHGWGRTVIRQTESEHAKRLVLKIIALPVLQRKQRTATPPTSKPPLVTCRSQRPQSGTVKEPPCGEKRPVARRGPFPALFRASAQLRHRGARLSSGSGYHCTPGLPLNISVCPASPVISLSYAGCDGSAVWYGQSLQDC